MAQKTGKPVHPQRGWDYLRLREYTPQVPRRTTTKRMPRRRRRSKKTLLELVAQVEAAPPTSVVELWAFDEHRIGLLPIVRKVWVKQGSRPVRIVETRYQRLCMYGFVQPQTGRTCFLRLPRMNATLYNQALADFAEALGRGRVDRSS